MTALALLPLLRFAFAVLSMTWTRRRRMLATLALVADAALLLTLTLGVLRGGAIGFISGGLPQGIGISFSADSIGLTIAVLTWGLAVGVHIYTWRDRLRPYFLLLAHLLIGCCYAMAFTKDLFSAYLILELLTLVSFLLVGYERKPRQILASLRYLVLCSLGMSLFLVGIAVVYSKLGTPDLDQIAARLATSSDLSWVPLATSLLIAGVAVKAGIFLFSLWLPAAHARAMPAVSAMLSGLVIKMGVVELFRISAVFDIHLPLLVLGTATGVLGILYATQTYNGKRVLAFHTTSQVGYLLVGCGCATQGAFAGALSYIVAHGLFKSLLFLVVGEMAKKVGTSDLRVLIERRSEFSWQTKTALAVGILGIIGMPPFAGYAAKAEIASGAHSTYVHLVVAALSIGTALSFAKFLPVLWGGSSDTSARHTRLSYAWFGVLILCYLPISRLLVPQTIWLSTLHWTTILEACLLIVAGTLGFQWLRRHAIPLPHRIFRLDEGPIVILAGFLLVFVLLSYVPASW